MEDGKAPKSSRTKDLAVSDEQAFSSALSDLNTGLQLDGIWSAIPQVELIAEGPLTKKGKNYWSFTRWRSENGCHMRR